MPNQKYHQLAMVLGAGALAYLVYNAVKALNIGVMQPGSLVSGSPDSVLTANRGWTQTFQTAGGANYGAPLSWLPIGNFVPGDASGFILPGQYATGADGSRLWIAQ